MKRSRIPEDFSVSARIMELAKEQGWPDPRTELEAFKDYHLAHGKLMLDWEAAFRTWLRNAQKWAKPNGYTKPAINTKPLPTQPKPAEPELTEEERSENRRKFGTLMHQLVKQFDVRKAHEKI